MSQQRSVRHINRGYNPHETHTDIEERCGVCGQLNALEYPSQRIANEPTRFGGISVTSTGTIAPLWILDPNNPQHPGVDGLATKDIEFIATAVGGCILCGSGNFRHARGPGGNAPRT